MWNSAILVRFSKHISIMRKQLNIYINNLQKWNIDRKREFTKFLMRVSFIQSFSLKKIIAGQTFIECGIALKTAELSSNYFSLSLAMLNDQWGTPRDLWVQYGDTVTKRTKFKIRLSNRSANLSKILNMYGHQSTCLWNEDNDLTGTSQRSLEDFFKSNIREHAL